MLAEYRAYCGECDVITPLIDLGRVPALLQRLASGKTLGAGLLTAGVYLKGKLAVYPLRRYGKQPFVSDRHRRGFFAKLRSGEITVPYQRTGKLGQSWTVEQRGSSVIVGTAYPNADIVQGSKQSFYHKQTGWGTAVDVAKREEPRIVAIAGAEIRTQVEG